MLWKVKIVLLFVSILSLSVQTYAASSDKTKSTIAVFPCITGEGITFTEGSFISERVTLEILKQGQYAVYDKYEIRKKLGLAVDFVDTCSTIDCHASMGQKCGVTHVLWGKLSRKDAVTVLELHYGNVAMGKLVNSVSTSIIGSTLELADQLPQLLADLFNMSVSSTTGNVIKSSSLTTALPAQTVYTPKVEPKFISLSARSEPAGATVYLNGDNIGVTPLTKDSLYDGTYDIAFDLYGYKKFSTQIYCKPNAEKKVFTKLEKAFGSLTVISKPTNAMCSIDNGQKGPTPFTCDTIRPGTYTLKLSLDLYAPFTKTILIGAGRQDTIIQHLVSLRYLDSLKQSNYKKFQMGRKIVFGVASACFIAGAVATELSARKAYRTQTSSYTAYTQLNSNNSVAEFDEKYATFKNDKNETDKLIAQRDVLSVVGAILCVGMAISFWF